MVESNSGGEGTDPDGHPTATRFGDDRQGKCQYSGQLSAFLGGLSLFDQIDRPFMQSPWRTSMAVAHYAATGLAPRHAHVGRWNHPEGRLRRAVLEP
jgi:hypothetical protein